MRSRNLKAPKNGELVKHEGVAASTVLLPVPFCCGTRPSQNAKCLPDLKKPALATVATMAVAVMVPTPGLVTSRWLTSFVLCRASATR